MKQIISLFYGRFALGVTKTLVKDPRKHHFEKFKSCRGLSDTRGQADAAAKSRTLVHQILSEGRRL